MCEAIWQWCLNIKTKSSQVPLSVGVPLCAPAVLMSHTSKTQGKQYGNDAGCCVSPIRDRVLQKAGAIALTGSSYIPQSGTQKCVKYLRIELHILRVMLIPKPFPMTCDVYPKKLLECLNEITSHRSLAHSPHVKFHSNWWRSMLYHHHHHYYL